MRKLLNILWEYFREAYMRWWWVAYGSVIGGYELVARLVPAVGMPSLSYEAILWLALPLLLIAPFPGYLKLRRELQQLRKTDWQGSFDAKLDLKFGSLSTLPIEEQRQAAIGEFGRLEAEILGGDFSHRYEMLAYQSVLLRLLRGVPPLFYAGYQKRVTRIVEVINEHDAHAAS